MDLKEQIRITAELLEGVKELNGDRWENVIKNGELLIAQLKIKETTVSDDRDILYMQNEIDRLKEFTGLDQI